MAFELKVIGTCVETQPEYVSIRIEQPGISPNIIKRRASTEKEMRMASKEGDTPMQTWTREHTYSVETLSLSPLLFKKLNGEFRGAARLQLSLCDSHTSPDAVVATLDYLDGVVPGGKRWAAHFDEFEILAAAAIFEVHTLVTEACEVIAAALSQRTIVNAVEAANRYQQVDLQRRTVVWLRKWLFHAKVGGVQGLERLIQATAEPKPDDASNWTMDGRNFSQAISTFPPETFKFVFEQDEFTLQRYYKPRMRYEMCYLRRDKSTNPFNPVYSIFLDHDDTFQLASIKDAETAEYNITNAPLTADAPIGGDHIASVSSNFLGTQFTIGDNGVDPELLAHPTYKLPLPMRKDLGLVLYERNVLGTCPRAMTALLRTDLVDRNQKLTETSRSLADMAKTEDVPSDGSVLVVRNVPPQWNEEYESYTLNFYNRVKQASKKNFQMVNPQDPDTILLLFGKVERDLYALDFMHPISLVQAIGIVLSSFDHKLAVT